MQLRPKKNNRLPRQRTEHTTNEHRQHIKHSTTERRSNDKHVNLFDLLYKEPKCYICHNFGHKALDCRLKDYKPEPRISCTVEDVKVWNKRE